MKILYIVPYVPNLIRVRPYNLIRYLAMAGHEVTVVAVLSDPEEQKDVEYLESMCMRVLTMKMPAWRSLLNSLFALLQRIPMQSRYSYHPALYQEITALFGSEVDSPAFDVVHIEHLRGMEYGLRLVSWLDAHTEGENPPVLWDSVDCISYLMHQAAQGSNSLKSRAIAMLEEKNTAKYERKGVNAFDRVLVTSPRDRMELSSVAKGKDNAKKIDVLPNGVDLEYFQLGDMERQPDTIVITGKMSYHANIAMVSFLVNEIMPLVWEQKQGVRLQIVGKDPPQSMLDMSGNPMITVTGTVKDIRPYLQQAALAVVPITYGAGIQNKVLEAMACGTPVVVSARSASALLAIPDQDYLKAETAQEFADAILNLLLDPIRRDKLGKAGRDYVEKYHDWHNIAEKLANIYKTAIHYKEAGWLAK